MLGAVTRKNGIEDLPFLWLWLSANPPLVMASRSCQYGSYTRQHVCRSRIWEGPLGGPGPVVPRQFSTSLLNERNTSAISRTKWVGFRRSLAGSEESVSTLEEDPVNNFSDDISIEVLRSTEENEETVTDLVALFKRADKNG